MLACKMIPRVGIRHVTGSLGAVEAAGKISYRFTLGREPADKMWETRSVNLSVRLPRDVARKAEAVQQSDPEFLSRVLLGGLTRRSIYEHLKKHEESLSPGNSDGR